MSMSENIWMVLKMCMMEMVLPRETQKEECCLSFVMKKELCVANTWYRKQEKKVTFKAGGNEIEIDFVLVGRKERKFLRAVKAISWELQHRLIIADVDKRKLKNMIKRIGF